jgi:hypothetical protein
MTDLERLGRLNLYHTRQLIQLLRMTYIGGGTCNAWESGIYYSREEIKSVLKNRPHIPNKIEGENLRRERSKTRKNARNNRYVRMR